MEHKELIEKIIGCAYQVYNKMGFGFLESIYEKCLMIELKKAGLAAESQVPIRVEYNDEIVGEFFADILVEGIIILELKSVTRIVRAHEIQVVNYLAATHKEIGLILNFSATKVEVKRKVRDLKKLDQQD
ncbi:MAG: GxxExxY protein [Kiritimatiellales bacterium]|nr:GxxExxY protein [Kiritimatiellota bacterium]MBL7012265.1 GxxExxY protein [Kiritimatiellales bacterium]